MRRNAFEQAWYKAFERVRLPDKPVSEINVLYSGSLDVVGERAAAVCVCVCVCV